MASINEKLDKCEVCAAEQAKYTCPKCEVRTCGLRCVNIHKKELECDGVRSKTKFIPLNAFTDLDLLSDYRLLEDIGRSVEQLQKNPAKRYTRFSDLPLHLQRLKGAARNRGVNLEFMPQNFSRHKQNSTFFDWKTNEFFWRVDLIFPQANNAKWVISRTLETKRLSTLLEEILDTEVILGSKNDEKSINLSILQHQLKFYRGCGLTGLKALLKAEKVEKSDSRFYELDLTSSLQENFKNKTIIEFPIIYISLKDHADMFETIDTDEEISGTIDEPQEYRRKIPENRRKRIKNVNIPQNSKSVSNYFFNADSSESEGDEKPKKNTYNTDNQELFIPDYNKLVKMDL